MEIVEYKGNIERIYPSELDLPFLVEEFVDIEYARTTITPKCVLFYEFVKGVFDFGEGEVHLKHHVKGPIVDKLNVIPISIASIADEGQKRGYGYPQCVMWMRMLWKAGKVRRFYGGLWQNAVQGNVTGLKWGVRYLW